MGGGCLAEGGGGQDGEMVVAAAKLAIDTDVADVNADFGVLWVQLLIWSPLSPASLLLLTSLFLITFLLLVFACLGVTVFFYPVHKVGLDSLLQRCVEL